MQGLHRCELGRRAAHLVAGDAAVGSNFERVAHDGGPAKLAHEGLGELLEGVGQDDDLGRRTQLVEELAGTLKGLDGVDDLLNLLDAHVVFGEHAQAPPHELVIVGLVARGARQLGDVGCAGELDPNLRNEHAFQVSAHDVHAKNPSISGEYEKGRTARHAPRSSKQVPHHAKSGFSSARRREATCTGVL